MAFVTHRAEDGRGQKDRQTSMKKPYDKMNDFELKNELRNAEFRREEYCAMKQTPENSANIIALVRLEKSKIATIHAELQRRAKAVV